MEQPEGLLVFDGDRCMESGPLKDVLATLKARFDSGEAGSLLAFDSRTGRQVDFDLSGTMAEVLARVQPPAPRSGPGRPRLGVVGREISLLPRHWEWLESQPNGASAAIRRLVEEARRREPDRERTRVAREATGRFMTAVAGNQPGFEEALRGLYAGDSTRFEKEIRNWPADIRRQTLRFAEDAWTD